MRKRKKKLISTGQSSSYSDGDNGYEADDEDALPPPPTRYLAALKVTPPHATSTFSKPEVRGILLTTDVHRISPENNNNNRSILDQVRGVKRKLDENENGASAAKRQKTYHYHEGPVRGVKRKFQGDYSEQANKRLKLSPKDKNEIWAIENQHLLPKSSSTIERNSNLNTTHSSASLFSYESLSDEGSDANHSSASFFASVSLSDENSVATQSSTSFFASVSLPGEDSVATRSSASFFSSVSLSDQGSDGNVSYKKSQNENEATSCPSSCVCNAGCSEEPEEEREKRSNENQLLIPTNLSCTDRSSVLNISQSSAAFFSSVSFSDDESNGNAPYKKSKNRNEATSCPPSCVCQAGSSEEPEPTVRSFATAVPLYKSVLTRNTHSLSNMQNTCCKYNCMRQYPREEVERSCLHYMNGDYDGSDALNREYHHWGWWKA